MNHIIQNILLGPVGIVPALLVMSTALLSVVMLSKSKRLVMQPVKYEAFDGLKGYLSIIVFTSHSATWYFYLRTGNWVPPPSNLYDQLGQSSISMFFMMTSFLFCTKLMQGKTNWLKLYIGRILRLFPVYLVAVVCLFFIIGCLSHFSLNQHESFLTIASQFRKWAMFTLKDAPNINNIQQTWIIVCNVTWTLRYEWFFYLLLPILSLFFFRNKPDLLAIAISIYIIFFILPYKEYIYLNFLHFSGGIIAALLIKFSGFSQSTTHWIFSLLILVLIIILVTTPTYQLLPVILTALIFIIVAGGNTIFGFLSTNVARKLGQLSYGIYLFHGMIFFILFKFVLGFKKASMLSSLEHWLCIILITPIIVLVSFIVHIYVELPAIQTTLLVYNKINEFISKTKQKIVVYYYQLTNSKFMSSK